MALYLSLSHTFISKFESKEIVITVNSAILHIWKFLREVILEVLIMGRKIATMWGNEC